MSALQHAKTATAFAGEQQQHVSREQGSGHQTGGAPQCTAGVQQWVHEASRWHMTGAPPQHLSSHHNDSSELRRRVSELAGKT